MAEVAIYRDEWFVIGPDGAVRDDRGLLVPRHVKAQVLALARPSREEPVEHWWQK